MSPPMSEVTIWHNPRCRKSREALKLIEERGVTPRIVRYLEEPPSRADLEQVLEATGLRPIELTRTKEKLFKELGLGKDDPDERILQALAEHPKLIERPVVFGPKGVVLARPPERAVEVL